MGQHIAVDWGSSSRRAWLFDGSGQVLARRQDAQGWTTAAPTDPAASLAAFIGDWRPGVRRVWMSGMVGSRQGWQEAPYLSLPEVWGATAPGGAQRLAAALCRRAQTVAGDPALRIVPGLCQAGPTLEPQVMRGEEMQWLGALADDSQGPWVLPGTHSKWISIEGPLAPRFTSYMTGELFHALGSQGALAPLLRGHGAQAVADQTEALLQGLLDAQGPSPLSRLFALRAEVMQAPRSAPAPHPDRMAARLSGLLIGMECLQAQAAGWWRPGDCVRIIGSAGLSQTYAAVLAALGARPQMLDSERCSISAVLMLEDCCHEA